MQTINIQIMLGGNEQDKDVIFDVISEMEDAGYSCMYIDNFFECVNIKQLCTEPEEVLGLLHGIDSGIKINVRKCSEYIL